MSYTRRGALAAEQIQELLEAGYISGAGIEHISPASLDLTLADEAYQINGLLLPRSGETVREALELMNPKPVDLATPLQAQQMYLIRCAEQLALPKQVYGYCNPKSSTGRLDTHVRVLADGVPRYDSVTPGGYRGELWLAVHPQSFALQVHPGTPLTQLRLFTADSCLSELDLEVALWRDRLLYQAGGSQVIAYEDLVAHDQDGALLLTPLISELDVCGYECIADPASVIDVGKISCYRSSDFFVPIYAKDGVLQLSRNKFYILSTAEYVRIPPTLASEMVPMDERSGDFRSHYAGFLDPGWGWGPSGEAHGRPFTLEVRPFEDIVIRKGQPIAKIKFERMAQEPAVHYDTRMSNYLIQHGPKLAKQFQM